MRDFADDLIFYDDNGVRIVLDETFVRTYVAVMKARTAKALAPLVAVQRKRTKLEVDL